MTNIESLFLLIFLCFNFLIALKSFYECKYKKNSFGQTSYLYPLSIYVWGDGVVFGTFLGLSALVTLLLQDFILFLLIISLFWLVRSVGETIYWFNEQFAAHHRNDYKSLPFNSVFHNDSIWFIFQICNQCITVVTLISSVYLFHLWLK